MVCKVVFDTWYSDGRVNNPCNVRLVWLTKLAIKPLEKTFTYNREVDAEAMLVSGEWFLEGVLFEGLKNPNTTLFG